MYVQVCVYVCVSISVYVFVCAYVCVCVLHMSVYGHNIYMYARVSMHVCNARFYVYIMFDTRGVSRVGVCAWHDTSCFVSVAFTCCLIYVA
jgi:hypothetical protein